MVFMQMQAFSDARNGFVDLVKSLFHGGFATVVLIVDRNQTVLEGWSNPA
jgi:hypothetical protein